MTDPGGGASESSTGVRAAGGVVWRLVDDQVEVLLVHRDRYDDWTFPKGKLDPDESWEQGAVREVTEETGMTPVLGPELAETAYEDRLGRAKRVRYWAMTTDATARFVANDEVDAIRWESVAHARTVLTYPRDRDVLDSLAAQITPESRA